MWTCDLFLYHDIELFSEIEIFQLKEDFDFKLRAFHAVDVHFVMKVGIVHFILSDSVIKILFVWFIQCLIC